VLIFKKVKKYKNLGDKYNKKPDDYARYGAVFYWYVAYQ
jgi:hypothetical protein